MARPSDISVFGYLIRCRCHQTPDEAEHLRHVYHGFVFVERLKEGAGGYRMSIRAARVENWLEPAGGHHGTSAFAGHTRKIVIGSNLNADAARQLPRETTVRGHQLVFSVHRANRRSQ
jgi:hypothetical protein